MNRKTHGGQGIPDVSRFGRLGPFALLVLLALASFPALARDAAFLDPGAGTAGASDEAIRVEPKNDIDIGESNLGVARRVDIFFVNQSGVAVKIDKMAINGDGNVTAEIASDDCSKQGTIAPGSRCNVEASITPTSPGPWSAEVLLTHEGAGRIARAKLSGKTGGAATGEKKDTGLSLSTKEINPVNFGEVAVGEGKTVRSALMVNDSPEPITLYSIDVIEASNGLQRLDQGCAVDMELKPGESCPVTLVWTPTEAGQVSTDLIIRHSGRLGFAVVPIRGAAKGIGSGEAKANGQSMTASSSSGGRNSSLPPPPSATELERAAAGRVTPVSAAALGAGANAAKPVADGRLILIGTVGERGVFLKPDGETTVANVGDSIDLGEKEAKVVKIDTRSADITIDGKNKTLFLEASADLIAKASASASKNKDANKDKDASPEILGSTSNSTPPAPPLGASSAPSGGLSLPSAGSLSMPSGSTYGSSNSTPSGASR